MRKLFTLAATLLVAGSAFAASPMLNSGRLFVKPNATSNVTLPATTNNDDSCDIAVTPAATLLLPYFEVDATNPNESTALNTLFTITNVSADPEIAHITVWTDWSYPVLDFNIFLTGYDVQGISLYDILARPSVGIPPTGESVSNVGADSNATNPNFLASEAANCDSLPGPIPADLANGVLSALTTGIFNIGGITVCGSVRVGGTHANAVGYITADVVDDCTQQLPTDPAYEDGTLLYDNALIGDYQRIDPTISASATGFASGGPLVHIRAIPEGGPNALVAAPDTTFPFTFYDRYNAGPPAAPSRRVDRRQPLPSVFAARYIDGGVGAFNTDYAIWREGVTGGGSSPSCSSAVLNSAISLEQIVRFDEDENPTVSTGGCQISPCTTTTLTLPETSLDNVNDTSVFPASTSGGGWMYLNLSNPVVVANFSNRLFGNDQVTQNWVIVRLTAEGRYGVDFDAAYLGNGCSPNPGVSAPGQNLFSPLQNSNPCDGTNFNGDTNCDF